MASDYFIAASVLVTLQAGALTWRIQRERDMEQANEPTWFPVADWLNLAGLGVLILGVFVLPVFGAAEIWTARLVGIDGILVVAFPFALLGHYEILAGARQGGNARAYCPPQERIVVGAVIVALLGYGVAIAAHAS
jgi:hypothetical protein